MELKNLTTATTNDKSKINEFVSQMLMTVDNVIDTFPLKDDFNLRMIWTPSKTRCTIVLFKGDIRRYNVMEINPRVRFQEIRYASRVELSLDAVKEYHANYNFKYQTYERTLTTLESDLHLILTQLLAEYKKQEVIEEEKTVKKTVKKTAKKVKKEA